MNKKSDGISLKSIKHLGINEDALETFEIEIHLEDILTRNEIRQVIKEHLVNTSRNISNMSAETLQKTFKHLKNLSDFL